MEARRAHLSRIRELGHDPWGGRWDDIQPIAEIRGLAENVVYQTEQGQQLPVPQRPAEATEEEVQQFRQWVRDQGKGDFLGPQVRAAGRIVFQRSGGKLCWLNLRDRTGVLQVALSLRDVGQDAWELVSCLDLGDIIGCTGTLKFSNTGELTIWADGLQFLSKCLEVPPDKHHGLADPEVRQRRRYLDLAHNDGVLERFLRRTQIVQSIRQSLIDRQFVEIEGPTLHTIAGGAAARPFLTHHNALDMQLYLRIALELHLKRLLVGGMERVFELGRVYRNEGISPRHNPEFTMLEAYQAYGDYRTMMELTEALIVQAIQATDQPLKLTWTEQEVDFTPPFARKTYHELLAEKTGLDPSDEAALAKYAASLNIGTRDRHPDVIKNEIFEEQVEDTLRAPTFVIDYPASICPLTKRKRDNPAVAERFELFVCGMEIANAYTELNDPDLQEELFRTQLAGLSEEDSMAKMDHDFVRALRHAMPPAGGLGVGIDRLVMLLTNSSSIRDVVLFPLLRQEASGS